MEWGLIQDHLFILETRLRQQEPYILKMPWHWIKKRIAQINKADDEYEKKLEAMKSEIRSQKTKPRKHY